MRIKFLLKSILLKKNNGNTFFKIDYWSGRFDYSKAPKDVKLDKGLPYDPVIIDDEEGIAIAVVFFPEPNPIKLDENGKYVWGS